MESKPLRVVHYLNQFFGGVGGEDKAGTGPQVKDGPIGPGRAIQQAFGDQGEVVATVICGDNYFVERTEEATEEVVQMVSSYRPDAVVAGPAFEAGRYGIACGTVCQAVQNKLAIPAVTGMYQENPGVELFRKDVYIVQTADSARGMADAVSKMVSIVRRLAVDQKIGKPAEEGYFRRGFIVHEVSEQTAAERVVSMLLNKIRGEPFESEVPRPEYDRVKPAPRIEDLNSAMIALVTDGGLVPKGNPDGIEFRKASRFGSYSFKGENALNPEDYEVSHVGYNNAFVLEDPHRLVPVDVMRDWEREGVIGRLHETFYSTCGNGSIVENIKKIGQAIAKQLKAEGVSGVILTST